MFLIRVAKAGGRPLGGLPVCWLTSPGRWAGRRILIIGHVATRSASDCAIGGATLERLIDADFGWREGWEYRLAAP